MSIPSKFSIKFIPCIWPKYWSLLLYLLYSSDHPRKNKSYISPFFSILLPFLSNNYSPPFQLGEYSLELFCWIPLNSPENYKIFSFKIWTKLSSFYVFPASGLNDPVILKYFPLLSVKILFINKAKLSILFNDDLINIYPSYYSQIFLYLPLYQVHQCHNLSKDDIFLSWNKLWRLSVGNLQECIVQLWIFLACSTLFSLISCMSKLPISNSHNYINTSGCIVWNDVDAITIQFMLQYTFAFAIKLK